MVATTVAVVGTVVKADVRACFVMSSTHRTASRVLVVLVVVRVLPGRVVRRDQVHVRARHAPVRMGVPWAGIQGMRVRSGRVQRRVRTVAIACVPIGNGSPSIPVRAVRDSFRVIEDRKIWHDESERVAVVGPRILHTYSP